MILLFLLMSFVCVWLWPSGRSLVLVGLLLPLPSRCLAQDPMQFAPFMRLNQQESTITNVLMWLKADAITGYTDGQSLSNWVDSGPYSMIVTQSISAQRPAYATSAIGANLLPSVRFNATNMTWLSLPQMFTNENAAEVFIMVKADVDPPIATQETNTGSWIFASTEPVSLSSVYAYTDGNIYETFCATARKTITLTQPRPSKAQWRCYNVSSTNDSWIARMDFSTIHSTAVNVFTNGVTVPFSRRALGISGTNVSSGTSERHRWRVSSREGGRRRRRRRQCHGFHDGSGGRGRI